MTKKVPTNDKIADSYDLDPNDNRWRKRVILNDTEEVLRGSLQIVKTTITTTSKKIDTPENASDFILFHQDEGETFFLSGNPATTAGIEMEENDVMEFTNMKLGNDNELYGITASGSVTVFAVGVYND